MHSHGYLHNALIISKENFKKERSSFSESRQEFFQQGLKTIPHGYKSLACKCTQVFLCTSPCMSMENCAKTNCDQTKKPLKRLLTSTVWVLLEYGVNSSVRRIPAYVTTESYETPCSPLPTWITSSRWEPQSVTKGLNEQYLLLE